MSVYVMVDGQGRTAVRISMNVRVSPVLMEDAAKTKSIDSAVIVWKAGWVTLVVSLVQFQTARAELTFDYAKNCIR